jgi:SAM-dependent methyltransferase
MASKEELLWWNLFADVMAEQWLLTPELNHIIRSGYEQDYAQFLYVPGGTFLEIGCGVGWIGHKFAARGMRVDGLDFSESQLEIAYRMAKEQDLFDVAYFTRDLVNDNLSGRFDEYDAILVNAVLHHLSHSEIEQLNARLSQLLAPGGRIYFYEPLAPHGISPIKQILAFPFLFMMRALLFFINRIGKSLSLFKPNFQAAIAMGYTGTSPDEAPIPIDLIRDPLMREGIKIVDEHPYHTFSIAIAMSIVRMRPLYIKIFTPLVTIAYFMDSFIYRFFGWENIGDEKFVMCAVKALRPKA